MHELRETLRDRRFWLQVALVFGVKLLLLLLSTPLYEIDTNSFIRGGFSWDIYHNPFLNIFIAVCTKIWANVWFIVALQSLFFAFAAVFLARTLFRERKGFLWASLALAALEPVTLFYNFSLLAENFFTAFAMLAAAMLIRWMRRPDPPKAALFGLMMGLVFLSKLSAMIHVPLFGLLLLRGGLAWKARFRGLGAALLPFFACYAFVFFGQKIINGGDIYTVEGRVRWDFSSSMYDSSEVDGGDFHRYVDPYIYRDGELVAHRELRRELSHLGYKDCVAEHEQRGFPANAGINRCDSLFGAVAEQITDRHFWAAEWQFIRDNVRFVHTLSYLDYRFTPGLHYYHPPREYAYLDSLMRVHYDFDLAANADRIPGIFTSLEFGNAYLPVWWWLWWAALVAGLVLWLKRTDRYPLLVLGVMTAVPLVFHLVYISYRPRFVAPYLVMVGMMVLWEIAAATGKPKAG